MKISIERVEGDHEGVELILTVEDEAALPMLHKMLAQLSDLANAPGEPVKAFADASRQSSEETVDYYANLWKAEAEQPTTDHGPRTTDHGPRTTDKDAGNTTSPEDAEEDEAWDMFEKMRSIQERNRAHMAAWNAAGDFISKSADRLSRLTLRQAYEQGYTEGYAKAKGDKA